MGDDQIVEARSSLEADGCGHTGQEQNGTGVSAMVAGGDQNKQLDSPTLEDTPLLSDESASMINGALDGSERTNGGDWDGAEDFEGLPWWRTPSVYWLLPGYGVYALAIGSMMVPRVNLILDLICREYLADQSARDPTIRFPQVNLAKENPQCHALEIQAKIQALATAFILYISLIGSSFAAVTSPKLGAISDRYGRTTLLMLTTLGGIVTEVIYILAANYPDTVHYSWILGGALIDGVCGSLVTSWALTHSYAADCTPPAKRAVAFGYFHACLFTGIALGPIIAAYMVKLSGTLISIFYFAVACHSLFFLAIAFIVPESLSKKRQLASRERHTLKKRARRSSSSLLSFIKSNNLFAPLGILYPTGEGSSPQVRANLLLLSAVDSVLFGIAMSAINVVILYSEHAFKWDNYETNLFLSIANSCRVAALVIVLPGLTYIFRTRYNKMRRIEIVGRNSGSDNFDLWIIRASILVEIVGYSGYALARRGGLFVLSGALASIGGIGSPTLQSALTKHVSHDRTGQLLGAMGLLHALARVVCPSVFSYIYIKTVDSLPHMVFVVLAGCFVLVFIFSCFVKPHVYLEEPSKNSLADYIQEDADRIYDADATGI